MKSRHSSNKLFYPKIKSCMGEIIYGFSLYCVYWLRRAECLESRSCGFGLQTSGLDFGWSQIKLQSINVYAMDGQFLITTQFEVTYM